MNNSVVVISRQWHRPEIKATISDSSVGVEMGLEDFLQAFVVELAAGIGNPTLLVTKAQLLSKLLSGVLAAQEVVTDEMKRKSVHAT